MNPQFGQELYFDALIRLFRPGIEWVDLGCGRELVRDWLPSAEAIQSRFRSDSKRLVGIDCVADDVSRNPYLSERVVGNLLEMPFPDQSFDLATANMVAEHISEPDRFLKEVKRVLRPGGTFLFLTPNAAHPLVLAARLTPEIIKGRLTHWLDGRQEADIFPTFYRMNTVGTLRSLLPRAGFHDSSIQTVSAFPLRPYLKGLERRLNLLVAAR